jgi:hypothetical protein
MTFCGKPLTESTTPRERERHPERDRLTRFMRGELTRDETRLVVRHLLAGCPTCHGVTGRLWAFGDRPLKLPPEERDAALAETKGPATNRD